ncbi:homeobox-like protein [Acrasis kona]|uniref:Homeobox-like protein n=1 Tax=Acrasis kona TaxID=1008807 RepID=A0AAW2ZA16_9EUKA
MTSIEQSNYDFSNQTQDVAENIITTHPLFSSALGTHLFQHTNLAPVSNQLDNEEGSRNSPDENADKTEDDQAVMNRIVAQIKENERRNIDNMLNDQDSTMNIVASQQSQKLLIKCDAENDPLLVEYLTKQSALHIMQKVELDMIHTQLDEYLERVRATLRIGQGDSENIQYYKHQQQQLLSGVRSGSPVSPPSPQMTPRMIQQIHQDVQDNNERLSDILYNNNNSNSNSNVQQQPQDSVPLHSTPISGTFAGKKQDEVINELKKKYSGQVLQVAQSKKKKKNFQKETSDHLNLWFFNNLHDPYPSDEVKKALAAQTNLSLSQVNNWFGNKRIRYKRRMLEQGKKPESGGSDTPDHTFLEESVSPGSKQSRKRPSRSSSKTNEDPMPRNVPDLPNPPMIASPPHYQPHPMPQSPHIIYPQPNVPNLGYYNNDMRAPQNNMFIHMPPHHQPPQHPIHHPAPNPHLGLEQYQQGGIPNRNQMTGQHNAYNQYHE